MTDRFTQPTLTAGQRARRAQAEGEALMDTLMRAPTPARALGPLPGRPAGYTPVREAATGAGAPQTRPQSQAPRSEGQVIGDALYDRQPVGGEAMTAAGAMYLDAYEALAALKRHAARLEKPQMTSEPLKPALALWERQVFGR